MSLSRLRRCILLSAAAASHCNAAAFHVDSVIVRSSQRSLPCRVASRSNAAACEAAASPVFLTRERGKNGKLQALLEARGVPSVELPCIAFQKLPEAEQLVDAFGSIGRGWVAVTSPEAAGVVLSAWEESGRRQLRVASVGAATAQVLEKGGLPTSFVPSKATARTLAQELPMSDDGKKVLYPCSALAADTLAAGLSDRGFSVTRLETYTTLPAEWDAEQEKLASSAMVVSFASPSAVRVWQERVGTSAIAVCIGETSAKEADKVGFEQVSFPQSPGVESWADTIAALQLPGWAAKVA